MKKILDEIIKEYFEGKDLKTILETKKIELDHKEKLSKEIKRLIKK